MNINKNGQQRWTMGMLLASLVLMMVAGTTRAEGTWLAGATIGQVKIGDYELRAESDTRLDDSDFGWRIFGAYQFNDNFGVGLSYLDLGTLDAAGTAFGGFTDTIDASAIEAYVIGIMPLNDQFSVFGTLGVFRWDQDVDYMDASETFNGSADGTDFAYGVGVAYWLNEQFGVHATWHRYPNVGDLNVTGHENDRDLFGAGIVFVIGN